MRGEARSERRRGTKRRADDASLVMALDSPPPSRPSLLAWPHLSPHVLGLGEVEDGPVDEYGRDSSADAEERPELGYGRENPVELLFLNESEEEGEDGGRADEVGNQEKSEDVETLGGHEDGGNVYGEDQDAGGDCA